MIRQEVEDKISSLVGAEMLYDLISVSVPYNLCMYVYCDNMYSSIETLASVYVCGMYNIIVSHQYCDMYMYCNAVK